VKTKGFGGVPRKEIVYLEELAVSGESSAKRVQSLTDLAVRLHKVDVGHKIAAVKLNFRLF